MNTIQWSINLFLAIVSRIIEFTIISILSVYYISEAIILSITPSFFLYQKSLRGKVVLVTGGAGGVGQELALRLARYKARVVVWDVNDKGDKIITIFAFKLLSKYII